MLRPSCVITIGSHTFTSVINLTINSSWDLFTDTATIIIPSKFELGGQVITDNLSGGIPLFSSGDAVAISVGYFPDLISIFTGYVYSVTPSEVITIKCEDEMYKLKSTNLKFTLNKATAKQVVEELNIDTIKSNVIDAELGAIRADNVNGCQVLEGLKKTYGIISYFKNGVLRVGLATYPDEGSTHDFSLFGGTVISTNLTFESRDTRKIGITAINIAKDNERTEVKVGSTSGEIRTIYAYNLEGDIQGELKRIAEQALYKFSISGYTGTFTALGKPRVQHGDRVALADRKYPERDGTYSVRSVNTVLSTTDGLLQTIEIGQKVA